MDNIKYEVVDDTTFNFKPAKDVLSNQFNLQNEQSQSDNYLKEWSQVFNDSQQKNENTTTNTSSYIPPSINQPSDQPGNMNVNQFNFNEKIRNYIIKNNPKIYILTPCYGSMCHLNYVTCLIHTMSTLKELGIEIVVEFCKNDSLVSRARNNLVAKAIS